MVNKVSGSIGSKRGRFEGGVSSRISVLGVVSVVVVVVVVAAAAVT